MNVVLIKLVNGENIITRIEDREFDYTSNFVHIEDPVLINVMRYSSNGSLMEAHVFSPWVPGSVTTTIKLPTRNIIAIVSITDKITQQYIEFINRDNYNEYNDDTLTDSDMEYNEEGDGMDVDEFVEETYFDNDEEGIEDERTPTKRIIH